MFRSKIMFCSIYSRMAVAAYQNLVALHHTSFIIIEVPKQQPGVQEAHILREQDESCCW